MRLSSIRSADWRLFGGGRRPAGKRKASWQSRWFQTERLEVRALLTTVTGDFNGDGFDDLAIGVPGENIGAVVDAGAVNVIYGRPTGLNTLGNQFWSQDNPGIADLAEAADRFGATLATDRFGQAVTTGDFNDDGRDDLAIGVPFEDIGAVANAGAVNVLYGGPVALTDAFDQVWSQASAGVLGATEAGDRFGSALAGGDFNGDGRDDLSIGVPGEDVGAVANAGAVNVLYGSPARVTTARAPGQHGRQWQYSRFG